MSRAVNAAVLESVHGRGSDRDVIDNLRHSLPQRQEWDVLRIQRHDDGVARPDLQVVLLYQRLPSLATTLPSARTT